MSTDERACAIQAIERLERELAAMKAERDAALKELNWVKDEEARLERDLTATTALLQTMVKPKGASE